MEILINLLVILIICDTSSVTAVVDPQAGFYGVLIPDVNVNSGLSAGYVHSDVERYSEQDYDGLRKFSYDYGVSDPNTGDHKKVWEETYGNGVKGGYSSIDPDGTERVVEYVADDINGFNAIVKKYGHSKHPLIYGKPYPGYGLPLDPAIAVPFIVPYRNSYNPVYRNEFFLAPRAHSYQHIEQYH